MGSTRESRISRLVSSLQRWAIGSPSRCTTASWPAKASAGGAWDLGSAHSSAVTSWPSVSRARPASRESTVTWSPRACSSATTSRPRVPVAPVTVTFNVMLL